MTPCTLWYRHDRVNGWDFNHLEDGHATTAKPEPKFPSQVWARATWERYHAWLTTDAPPRVTFVGPHDYEMELFTPTPSGAGITMTVNSFLRAV